MSDFIKAMFPCVMCGLSHEGNQAVCLACQAKISTVPSDVKNNILEVLGECEEFLRDLIAETDDSLPQTYFDSMKALMRKCQKSSEMLKNIK